jgi:hypothetical protein
MNTVQELNRRCRVGDGMEWNVARYKTSSCEQRKLTARLVEVKDWHVLAVPTSHSTNTFCLTVFLSNTTMRSKDRRIVHRLTSSTIYVARSHFPAASAEHRLAAKDSHSTTRIHSSQRFRSNMSLYQWLHQNREDMTMCDE